MGQTVENPTYEQVCTNTSGHAEVAQVTFDSNQVSYSDLLDVFWSIHDPTQYHRQGPDIGSQYRSVIFFHSTEQYKKAEQSKQQLQASKNYPKDIVTEITQATDFWVAEEYHQRYFEKHGMSGCPII